jgi:hypothetical protein
MTARRENNNARSSYVRAFRISNLVINSIEGGMGVPLIAL